MKRVESLEANAPNEILRTGFCKIAVPGGEERRAHLTLLRNSHGGPMEHSTMCSKPDIVVERAYETAEVFKFARVIRGHYGKIPLIAVK